MALAERFTHNLGTIMGVQAIPGTGITSVSVTGAVLRRNNFAPERIGVITLDIDGDTYQIDVEFRDENLDGQDFLGHHKKELEDHA